MNEAASSRHPDMWYFNYTSGVRAPPTALSPWEFARGHYDPYDYFIKGVNIQIDALINTGTPTRYGVIMLDYPTDSKSPKFSSENHSVKLLKQ